MPEIILVCGGRHYGEQSYKEKQNGVWVEIKRPKELWLPEMLLVNTVLHFYKPSLIVQGFALGADHMARRWADKNGVEHTGMKFKADWGKYRKGAGPIRNKRMLDENPIDLVIAFEGGSGTANMVKQAQERGLDVIEPKISIIPK